MATLPNALSLLRILLAPVFLFFSVKDQYPVALFIFCIACITDWADGYLARLLNATSPLGKLLDPIADKILLMASFGGFFLLGKVPLWLTSIVIGRDLVLMVLGLVVLLRKWSLSMDVHYISKVNTTFQMISIAAVIVFDPSFLFVMALFYLTAMTTVLSGFSYLHHFQKWYTQNRLS